MTERSRWIGPGLLIGLVVVLVVVALNREPASYDPNSPEGTVQTYLVAIADEDYETAFDQLDPQFYEGCSPSDIATNRNSRSAFTASISDAPVDNSSEEVIVSVRMNFTQQGPFESSWSSWEDFVTTRSGDGWLITGPVWPYFGWACSEGDL